MRKRTLPALVFWGVVAASAAFFGREPDLNWDGIAYVALALEREFGAEEAHRRSYAYLRELASEARYEELTHATPYREAMATSPEAFGANLRFYRMRQGYVGLLHGAHRFLGANPFRASTWIGIAAFLFLAGSVWAWSGQAVASLRQRREEAEWLRLGTLPLLLQPAALGSIPLCTPDLLAGALLGWGAYFQVVRRELPTAALFYVLAVLSRPDALILSSLFLGSPAALAALERIRGDAARFGPALVPLFVGLGVVAVGLVSIRLWGAHGWGTVFRHTFVENEVFPAEAAPSVGEYLRVVGTAIVFLGSGVKARALFCLTALAVVYLLRHPLVSRERRAYATAALASWIAFFFLFPLPLERFYVAHVAIVGGMLFQTLAELVALAMEEGRSGYWALLRPRLVDQAR